MIELKNIDLSKVTYSEQYNKAREEEREFYEAFMKYQQGKDTKDHVIEELLDEFQSKLGLVNKWNIKAEDIMREYPKHLEKLKNRPRRKAAEINQDFESAIQDMASLR